MPADNYIINSDDSKVKLYALQIKSSNERKHVEEVITDGKKQLIEIVDSQNAIIPELRIGSHTGKHEDVIRQAAICYNEHNHNNIVRRKKIQERINWWNKLEKEKQDQILKKYPHFRKKLEMVPIVDAWSDHCLVIGGVTTNLSVSSLENGGKPLVHRYLEPHTKQETIERMKPLPEDEKKKGFLGDIFG